MAGPFGGCFAVQQTDTKAKVNTPGNIGTQDSLDFVLAQVDQNIADLPKAVKANQNAGGEQAQQNAAAVTALLGLTVVTKAFPTATPEVVQGGGVAAIPTAVAGGNNGNGNGNGTVKKYTNLSGDVDISLKAQLVERGTLAPGAFTSSICASSAACARAVPAMASSIQASAFIGN